MTGVLFNEALGTIDHIWQLNQNHSIEVVEAKLTFPLTSVRHKRERASARSSFRRGAEL